MRSIVRILSAASFVLVTSPLAAQQSPPPSIPAPPSPPTSPPLVELTTLRLMLEKGVISQAEYDSAQRDLEATSSAHALDSSTLVIGKWATTLYGFVEADYIYDTTQSFNESAGNAQVARAGTYAGDNGRSTFSIRNSRIGVRSKAPEYAGIRASAQLEMDFLGTQLPVGTAQPYNGSEAAFFSNPTFRARHLYLKVETPVVDFLFGQYWQLFGWQSGYHPNTVQIQGVPGEIYSRTAQLRISKTLKSDAVTFEVAVAAMRPPQRDSATPEGQGGLRFAINKWTGVQTAGSTSTSIAPASIALTGDLRRVVLPEFNSAPKTTHEKVSSAIAVDAFLPIIPGSKDEMGNSLSLTGEVASGYGTADLYTGLSGGISNPTLPNPTNASPAPTYAQNIDNGIAVYDANGALHFIQWTSFVVGAQYYLPKLHGRVWISGNYSRLTSANSSTLGTGPKSRSSLDWFDVNLFTDVTPAVRLGAEYSNFNDTYVDGTHAINHRAQVSAFYLF